MDYLLNLYNDYVSDEEREVLNLIINGLPSKLRPGLGNLKEAILGFKPYYKWITF